MEALFSKLYIYFLCFLCTFVFPQNLFPLNKQLANLTRHRHNIVLSLQKTVIKKVFKPTWMNSIKTNFLIVYTSKIKSSTNRLKRLLYDILLDGVFYWIKQFLKFFNSYPSHTWVYFVIGFVARNHVRALSMW